MWVGLNTTAVVNLATLGGINQIDYSEDHRCGCIGGGMLWGIAEDKDGAIWVGKLDGILRYDGKSVTYFKDK